MGFLARKASDSGVGAIVRCQWRGGGLVVLSRAIGGLCSALEALFLPVVMRLFQVSRF